MKFGLFKCAIGETPPIENPVWIFTSSAFALNTVLFVIFDNLSIDKNLWYDFGSGQGGNAIDFLIEYERISFVEAVRSLAKKYNIEIVEIGDTEQDNIYDQLYEIHEIACIYFQNNLKSNPKAKVGQKYLEDRNFSDSIVKDYRLGVALDSWDALFKEVSGKFDEEILKKSGLFSESKISIWLIAGKLLLIILLSNCLISLLIIFWEPRNFNSM